jgi:hypothetical protein
MSSRRLKRAQKQKCQASWRVALPGFSRLHMPEWFSKSGTPLPICLSALVGLDDGPSSSLPVEACNRAHVPPHELRNIEEVNEFGKIQKHLWLGQGAGPSE